MIDVSRTKRYCKDDISKIENYDEDYEAYIAGYEL